jgi:hypothetical protein
MAGPISAERKVLPADIEGRRRNSDYVLFRCAPCLILWVLPIALLSALCVFFNLSNLMAVCALFATLYCIQGLLADLPGVRVDAETVRAPNRPWPALPFAVFARRRVRLGDIERVVVRSGTRLVNSADLRTESGSACRLLFASRQKRREFYYLVAELRPGMPVVKVK